MCKSLTLLFLLHLILHCCVLVALALQALFSDMALKQDGSELKPATFVKALEANRVIPYSRGRQEDVHEMGALFNDVMERAFRYSSTGDRSAIVKGYLLHISHSPSLTLLCEKTMSIECFNMLCVRLYKSRMLSLFTSLVVLI